MSRVKRIVIVTAGLLAGGAIAGGLAGSLLAILVALIKGGMPDFNPRTDLLFLALIGATFGAPLGAVLFPAAGWLLMRRVPLGRAVFGTMLGTIAGGMVGWFAMSRGDHLLHALWWGFGGFALSSIVLRASASRGLIAAAPDESSGTQSLT